MTFEDLAAICCKEIDNESKLISASLVVMDSNSGEIRVYDSNKYGGISKYNESDI